MRIPKLITSALIVATLTATAQEPIDSVDIRPDNDVLPEIIDMSIEQQFRIAMPYAVDAIISQSSIFAKPFSEIDGNTADRLINDARMLSSADPRLIPVIENAENVLGAARKLSAVADCFDRPFDRIAIDSLSSELSLLTEDNRLSDAQISEIKDAKKSLDNYYFALLRFQNIIEAVNAATAELKEIPNSRMLAVNEVNAVLENKKNYIEFIGRYKWLQNMLSEYIDDVTSDPAEGSPKIEETISNLINGADSQTTVIGQPEIENINENSTTP